MQFAYLIKMINDKFQMVQNSVTFRNSLLSDKVLYSKIK